MNNNKSWYEKISIFIGIISGVCTILGISVFGIINYHKENNMPIDTSETESAEGETQETKSPEIQDAIESKPTETIEKETVSPETPPTNSSKPSNTPSSTPSKEATIPEITKQPSNTTETTPPTINTSNFDITEAEEIVASIQIIDIDESILCNQEILIFSETEPRVGGTFLSDENGYIYFTKFDIEYNYNEPNRKFLVHKIKDYLENNNPVWVEIGYVYINGFDSKMYSVQE